MDSGRQRTFIREDISRKLQLQVLGETNVQLNAFGDTYVKTYMKRRRIGRIPLCSQYDDRKFVVEAIEVPFISNDIVHTLANLDFVNKVGLQQGPIADLLYLLYVPTEEGICLLVRSDQLWQVIDGTTLCSEGDRRLVATSTALGWTFQGSTWFRASLF